VVKVEFANANEAFMSLQAALSAGDIFTISVWLKRIPDACLNLEWVNVCVGPGFP